MNNNSAKSGKNSTKSNARKRFWEDTYADYPGVGKIYDTDVGEYAFKHLRWRDRFNPKKVGYAVIGSELIAFGVISKDELPKKKNWKFIRDF